jgi:hypothetical protein
MHLLKFSIVFCSLAVSVAGDQTADFKSFTENPGPYLEVDFAIARPQSPMPAFRVPRNFYVIWQTNAFLLRQYDDPRELSTNAYVVGRELMGEFGNQHWDFEKMSESLHVCDDVSLDSGAGEKAHSWSRALVAIALTGGIQYADIGIIKWTGNSFTALNTNLDYELKGELTETGGIPTTIAYQMHDKKAGKTYTYRSTLSDWKEGWPIPAKVQVESNGTGPWVDVARVEIKSFKRGATVQNRQVFSYEPFFRPDIHTIQKRIGKTYYTVDSKGRLRPVLP